MLKRAIPINLKLMKSLGLGKDIISLEHLVRGFKIEHAANFDINNIFKMTI